MLCISDIIYLGHGEDFDSFCVNINNQEYVIRIIRDGQHHVVNKLKFEMKFMSILTEYFVKNQIDLQIPLYNDPNNEITQYLSNTSNNHSTYQTNMK